MSESDLPSDEEMEAILGEDPGEVGTPEQVEAAVEAVDNPTFAQPNRSASQGASLPEPPSLPYEDPDEETPPDEAVPAFIVQRNKWGPGAHGIYLADGTPVGVWLYENHSDLDGGQVAELLVTMGLDGDLAAWYGIQRDNARLA